VARWSAAILGVVIALTAGCGGDSRTATGAAIASGSSIDRGSPAALSGSAEGSATVTTDASVGATTTAGATSTTTTATTTTDAPPSGSQTFVVDNAAVADASKPMTLAVRPGDRIQVHLARDFYKYTCCDVGGDGGVLHTETSSSDGYGNVEILYTVVAAGHATLSGSADPGCRDSKPACGAASRQIVVEVNSVA
jgi:hypothetical protein